LKATLATLVVVLSFVLVAPASTAEVSKFRAVKTPATWSRAVELVRRYYGSGSAGWLYACASSEGGSHGWIPNHAGSGAGGWLQFKAGTFYSVIDDGIRDARRRGMRPAWARSVRSWYSPLGQALAGLEMIRDGRVGEWDGARC
jgi:hypothetical protein